MRSAEKSKRLGPRGNWILLWTATSVGAVAIGAACAWAVITVLLPREDPLESTDYTYVEVNQGDVGDSMTLNAVAEWKQSPMAANRASGVVTGVNIQPGGEVTQGTALYTVNLRPVVTAEGAVPMFRSIGDGTEGPDVAQVQGMLSVLGHYRGTTDGKVGDGTVTAIKRWQKALGLEESGVIGEGDIIFVPDLPARVTLNEEIIHAGASLGGGEQVLLGLPAAPDFSIPVTDAQANMIPTGTRVEVSSPEGTLWAGTATEQVRDSDSGDVAIVLTGDSGAPVCGDGCGQIPVGGQSTLTCRIVTVETTSGLVVPSAALTTTADGETVVVDRRGKRHSVAVEASAKGMSVVTGVPEGISVRVPARASADDK